MSAPTRRAVLAGTAVAALAAVAATGAAAAEQNPDAELIRICARHCVNMDAYNSSDEINGLFETGDKPLWTAYLETRIKS